MKYGTNIQFYIIQFGERRYFSGVFLAYSGDGLYARVESAEYGRTWVSMKQILRKAA